MTRKEFNQYIQEASFQELFVTEMGWNNPKGMTDILVPHIDDIDYEMEAIAERNGFQILTCLVEKIPTASTCKKIDIKLRQQAHDYICIYIEQQGFHHQWVAPVNKVEKRDIVTIEYTSVAQAEFLYTKIPDLSFDFNENTTIMDVKQRIQGAFMVNSEKITKDFYAGFKKEHTQFVKYITGINDEIADDKKNKEKQWYASVMLNRLMFCYFIQKKGFLDMNENYLRDKLSMVQRERGENEFFQSFYKGFLIHLFHEGLNGHQRNEAFLSKYGRIPYLNGGMFDFHDIEKMFKDIDIDDEAFLHLFDFFDKWRWHLDTRITASGKDINPDVLGYIFEQYINDRAQMGAYYTKEDITEYIGKNCILPFLFDSVKKTTSEKDFKEKGYIWQTLQQSGDKYIYDAVKHGYTADWLSLIPGEIAEGVDTTQPQLLERRSHWNDRTPEPFNLPTEIWRETIERFQRCDDLLQKISAGEIHEINDFITYNLDIRQFTYDLLLHTEDHLLVEHFYHAMQHVSILDPTCGSGAFLFAAMNILEPLYEICITRMEEFHQKNEKIFIAELEEISKKYRSNIQYFIYKSIILRNLYGVDIMEEAVEIAKLRLFLKMVAVVEVNPRLDNLGLDPLPDIDFNIRCGNTLVGYATEKELDDDLNYGDMFAKQEFKDKVELEMEVVARAYEQFKDLQLTSQEEASEFKESKMQLKAKLSGLNDLLNHKLFSSMVSDASISYEEWLSSHQPFHWLAEYYHIMHSKGGFDVIIGNPPYVAKSKINYLESRKDFKCSDLYGYVIKRVFQILKAYGSHGFIVMHNLAFSRNFADVRKIIHEYQGSKWFSFYGRIPSGLFDGDVRVRNCIYILNKNKNSQYTTNLHRWFTLQRDTLFRTLCYSECKITDCIPMLYSSSLQNIFEFQSHCDIEDINNGKLLYFKQSAYNWLSISEQEPPCFDEDNNPCEQSMLGCLKVNKQYYPYIILLFSGKLYMSKWLTYGDEFHLTTKDLLPCIFPFNELTDEEKNILDNLYSDFSKELPKTLQYKPNAGKNVGSYNTSKCWKITDKSDIIFLKHLSDNPLVMKEQIENHLAHTIITEKK